MLGWFFPKKILMLGLIGIGFVVALFLLQPSTHIPLEDLPVVEPSPLPVRQRPQRDGSVQLLDHNKRVYRQLDQTKPKQSVHTIEELLPLEEIPTLEEQSPTLPPPTPQPVKQATPAPTPSIAKILARLKKGPSSGVLVRKSGKHCLQLGSFPTQELAEREWKRIASLWSEVLDWPVRPSFERVDRGAGRGVVFRILLKGIVQAKDAQALCQKLKQRKMACIVVVLP